jgi:hypothetical protein
MYVSLCVSVPAGISYIPAMIEEDRSATMSRIETRKNKKGNIHVLPASSEEMLEGTCTCTCM